MPCRIRALAALLLLSGTACGGASPITGAPQSSRLAVRANAALTRDVRLKRPALISIDQLTGDLLYWPIENGPGGPPITLTGNLGTYQANAMASNGNLVIIASYAPAELIEYNVKTKRETTLPDTFGSPSHVAVGKSGTVYALSAHEVGVFPQGSSQPYEITCKELSGSEPFSVAVDDESDVFVETGYGSFTGVLEVPAGSSNSCVKLHLGRKSDPGGIGIDPKTDDLILIDNPGYCAGGDEGRMTIYPKPYANATSTTHHLHAGDCAGGFRLDATSTHIYVSDSTIDESYPLIDVRTYPDGKGHGAYEDYSAYLGGFTLIPSALPN
ncbi:MAG: hypothetical protein WA668_07390 [Candidatus Cybelea sp.]